MAATLNLETITVALQFAESMVTPPIRLEEKRFVVTHERHADAFVDYEVGATDWKLRAPAERVEEV